MAIGSCFQPDLQQETVVKSRAEGSRNIVQSDQKRNCLKVADKERVVVKEISIIRKKPSSLWLDNRKTPEGISAIGQTSPLQGFKVQNCKLI